MEQKNFTPSIILLIIFLVGVISGIVATNSQWTTADCNQNPAELGCSDWQPKNPESVVEIHRHHCSTKEQRYRCSIYYTTTHDRLCVDRYMGDQDFSCLVDSRCAYNAGSI